MSIQELLIYWQVIRKRLWLIILLMGVTLSVILVMSYLSKPIYRATTSFQVTAPLPAEVSLFTEFRTPNSRDELVYTRNNFVAVLESEFVAGEVIEELGLNMHTDELLGQVIIEADANSDFIKLRATAQDPQLATAIANSLINRAAQLFGELSAGSITANKEFIQQQLDEIKDELDQATTALVQFQIENRIGSPDGFLKSQDSLITALKSSRDKAHAEGNEAEATSYDGIIEVREKELQELLLLSSEYEALRDTVARIEETYAKLLDKETEAELKENEIVSARFIRIIPAREPSRPLPRLNLKILLLGGIVSLVLGIMLAFALEYREQADVEADKEDVTDSREPKHSEQIEALERTF